MAKPPGPQGAHKLTDEVMEFVAGLRAHSPGLGSKVLAGRIEERFGRSVHPRSIERALKRREKNAAGCWREFRILDGRELARTL